MCDANTSVGVSAMTGSSASLPTSCGISSTKVFSWFTPLPIAGRLASTENSGVAVLESREVDPSSDLDGAS